MKNVALLIILTLASLYVSAQKIVVGGKVPEIKDDKVEWLSFEPTKNRAILYDFYSSQNPSCVKEYALLAPIYKAFAGKLDIVLLSPKSDANFIIKANADGGKYSFGVNADESVFTAFGVQYLPFYMLTNAQGEMVWQGNISTLTIADVRTLCDL